MGAHATSTFLNLAVTAPESKHKPMTASQIIKWAVRKGKHGERGAASAKALHAEGAAWQGKTP